ncbi:MAG: cytochrome c oxidase subunit II [Pyrinomonadaceae bacterium]
MQQDSSWVPLFPEQASTFAWQVDGLYFYITAVSAFFTIAVVVAIIFFFIKYREKEKYETGAEIHGSIALETAWSIIPFIISMTIFLGGAVVFYNQYRPPAETTEIYVVGKQWMWKFQHGTGQREINDLHIPVGRNIKLTMTTEDVIHDLFIPAFRTKVDVVPGRYSHIWFNATKPGKYHLFCAEYCGLNHSGMGGTVYVMEQRDFDNWLSGNVSGQTPVEVGQDLFENKLGCASCHAGGANQRGAKLEGLFGTDVKLTTGQTVTANDEYIRNSILNPGGQIVEGYQPIMPTFKGQVTEEQLIQLVAYVKSLSTNKSGSTTAGNTSTSNSNGSTAANTATNVNKLASNPNAPNNRPETTGKENR